MYLLYVRLFLTSFLKDVYTMNFYFEYFKEFCDISHSIQEITVKIFGISSHGFPTKKQKKILSRCNNRHCKCNKLDQCNIYQKFHPSSPL